MPKPTLIFNSYGQQGSYTFCMPADSGTWIFSVKQMIVAHADPTQNPDTIKWMGTTTMSAAAGLGGVKKLGPSLTPAGLAILVSLLLITTIVIYRRRILS